MARYTVIYATIKDAHGTKTGYWICEDDIPVRYCYRTAQEAELQAAALRPVDM